MATGSVSSGIRQLPVHGVAEHRVLWWSPPLWPLTSARAVAVAVRLWGDPLVDGAPASWAPQARSPYLWPESLGGSCGPLRMPPRGSTMLTAAVDYGHRMGPHGLAPADALYQRVYPDGLSDEMVTALTDVFGPPEIHDLGFATQARAFVDAWWRQVVAVVVVVGLVWLYIAWRIRVKDSRSIYG